MTPRPWPWRVLAFLGNGVVNTIVTYLLYLLLLRQGLAAGVAFSLSFAAGVVLSGVMNVGPVFGARLGAGTLLRYAAAYLAVWALGLALVTGLTALGVPPEVAPLLAMPVTIPAAWLLIGRVLRGG